LYQFGLSSADTPDNVSSRLSIHIPHNLYKSDGYDHREALFGIPPFGGSIAQKVYYADSDLCDPTVDTRKGYPTRDKDETGKQAPWESPYILMVDRGGCTFVQKVRNAQRSGAAGVIIADNSCLCGDADCVEQNLEIQCQNAEPIMADDGSGSDITVPSFLMFKHDADKVKETVKQGILVQLEMAWALPSPDDRVEYDLWTVPTEHVSREFQRTFKHMAKALGDRAYFTPHMYIYDGIKSGCQGREGENQCYTLCTNNGRYCATDPDSNLDEGISGADVVIESLRRICIWKHYGESDGIGQRWWEYVTEFMERCDSEDIFNNEACCNDVMKKVGVDHLKIEQCMKDSGGVENDNVNTFLDTELAAQEKRGVVVLPTAFVNTAAIRGALSINSVFTAICAGYLAGTRPAVCECTSCPNILECASTGGMCAAAGKKGGVSMHTFVFSLVGVAVLVSIGGVYYYRKSQADMREQVRGILAEYMPLEDTEGEMAGDINPATEFAKRAGQTLIDN
jgi:hypothetical protein